MPVRHCLAALLLSGAAIPAAAQDAQSLIAKNLEARGGAATLAAIKNVSFEGRTILYESGSTDRVGSPFTTGTGRGAA